MKIKKRIWVKGLQIKLDYYRARNVVQKQEIRRLKQKLRDGAKYIGIKEAIRLFILKVKYFIWKK